MFVFFFFKQKTAYEMRISDWSSDVCASDLLRQAYHCVGEDSRLAVATQQRAGSGVIDAEFALQARLWRALARQFQNQRVRGQFHRGDVLHPRADLCADLLASVDGRMDDDAASERLVAVERRFPTRTEV